MSLETGTYVGDLVPSNPPTTDSKQQGDDHLRLLKTVLKNTFPNATKPYYFPAASTKTSSYVVLSTDVNKFLIGDGTSAVVTFTLPALAASDDGWRVLIQASNITNAVTVVPPSGTIDGFSSITLFLRQLILIWWDGSNYHVQQGSTVDIASLTALTAPAIDDSVPIYDLSATANRKIALSDLWKIVNLLAAETTLATDDVLPLYDTSESAANSMTVANFFKIINAFTEDTTPEMAADFVMTYDTSASAVKKAKLSNVVNPQIMHVAETQTSGTANPNYTSGAYRTRLLNTAHTNDISGASLASNQVTLPAGTYWLEAWADCVAGNQHKVKWRNVTDSTDTLIGHSTVAQNSAPGGWSHSHCVGKFTIASSKVFELQTRFQTTAQGGTPSSFGDTETYSAVVIWKLS